MPFDQEQTQEHDTTVDLTMDGTEPAAPGKSPLTDGQTPAAPGVQETETAPPEEDLAGITLG